MSDITASRSVTVYLSVTTIVPPSLTASIAAFSVLNGALAVPPKLSLPSDALRYTVSAAKVAIVNDMQVIVNEKNSMIFLKEACVIN